MARQCSSRVRSCLLPKPDFRARHREAEQPLKAWHEEAARATWKKPTDIKARYRNASILKNRRVVFNVKGNDYRHVAAVAYRIGVVYVKFVGKGGSEGSR